MNQAICKKIMHRDQVGFTQRMFVQYLKSNVFTSMKERKKHTNISKDAEIFGRIQH